MIKKFLAGAALAASVVAVGAASAAPAMAIGDESGLNTVNGNGAEQSYGNTHTDGMQSPQIGLVQGSLNKLCAGVPVKANVGSLVGILVPVTAQDINVLASPQNQQCAENSTQGKGDEAASHILNQIPVLSGNGAHNG
ncbi:RdlA protein [Streptomyces sp. SID13666]|uniref:rodlin n=1 Tax=Streptomyces TaxID=1883 RepID=UPI0011075610|nr:MULTISPECIES: rodlin [Streptomyces]MCZ4094966.1 rodlin [Streptomyces sp. H39-C1]NEA58509.1 RdlA protein [Streptomyces sp. SID13666]NEA72503.1 RdlA protein [Streptomyces sp. SID13588]QNA74430.1 RdlA protein [Streptomyces sp. So13.3]